MTHPLWAFSTLAVLLAAEAATAQSARIVFVSTRSAADPGDGGNIEIFSADVDQDTPPRQLTESARINWQTSKLTREKVGIACSPRGDRIAFTANRGGNRDLYLIDIDGTGEVRLTTDAAHDQAPTWSPDGQRIAFRSDRSGDVEIYVVNVDGSGLARLTDSRGRDDNPAWSPDGNRIAFTSTRDGLPAIFAMDPDGGNVEKLTHNDRWTDFSSWSPDGQQIVFQSDFQIETLGNHTISRLNLATGQETPICQGYWPSWAPSDRIVFSRSIGDGHTVRIFVTDAQGANEFMPGWSTANDVEAQWLPALAGTPVRRLSWGAIKAMTW